MDTCAFDANLGKLKPLYPRSIMSARAEFKIAIALSLGLASIIKGLVVYQVVDSY